MVQFAKIFQYKQKNLVAFVVMVTIWIQLVTKCIYFALTELHRSQKCFGITLIILIENEAFPIKIYWMKPLLIIRVIDLERGWDGVLDG